MSKPEVKIICDSIAKTHSQRITTMEVKMHRFILPEFNTHRKFCLDGDSLIYFSLPGKLNNGYTRTNKIKLSDLYLKWLEGTVARINKPKSSIDLSIFDDNISYSIKELEDLSGKRIYKGNLAKFIREGKLKATRVFNNPSNRHGKYYILGSDLKKFYSQSGTNKQPLRDRITQMKIQQLNEDTLEYQTTNITDIYYSGKKECFEVVTKFGNVICGSADHRIHTNNGWKTIGELDIITDRVSGRRSDKKRTLSKYNKYNGVWIPRWSKTIKPKILEKQENLCHDCRCELTIKTAEIHHIVPRCEDMSLSLDENNVICLCKECHKKIHKNQNWTRGKGSSLSHHYEEIIEIRSVGERETYDISVAGNFENFVANGIVVHNSRNSASSRAIPISKQIEKVKNDPAIPVFWGKNQSGMSAREELSPEQQALALEEWLTARDEAVIVAEKLERLGVHKQITNRVLEPFMWHIALVTSTEWENFFEQRIHADAQPEMEYVAKLMKTALNTSTPKPTDIHLPFITDDDLIEVGVRSKLDLIKIAIARCARVSYLNHDGKRSIQKDLNLFQMLYGHVPRHSSPMEHIAIVGKNIPYYNLDGWGSIRYLVQEENLKLDV